MSIEEEPVAASTPTQHATPEAPDPHKQMRRISRRSFLWAGVAVIGAAEAFHWLDQQPLDAQEGILKPLRQGLDFNEKVASALYSPNRLSPTYKPSDISPSRVNGDLGLSTDDFSVDDWELDIDGVPNTNDLALDLDDIKALPRVQFVTELKCIEGWSIFVQWAGARFADFHAKYPSPPGATHVYMETPDQEYYVSIELPSMLHPQTLLCYEMNGKPLTLDHGAPLRLVIPHKYGVKNIKRIGLIRYEFKRGKDYWAEQGYDYYAGL